MYEPGPPGGPPSGPDRGVLYAIIAILVIIVLVLAFLLLDRDDDEEPRGPVVSIGPETETASPTVGVLESPLLTPSPTASPTLVTDFPLPGDEEFLFTHVPTEIQPTCERQDPGLMPPGAQAGIECNTNSGADFVRYFRYSTKSSMDAQYRLALDIAGAVRDLGSCPSDIPAELSYTRAGNEIIGRLVCYEADGQGRIDWTNDKLLIYSESVSLDGMSDRLFDFWKTAGPLPRPQS